MKVLWDVCCWNSTEVLSARPSRSNQNQRRCVAVPWTFVSTLAPQLFYICFVLIRRTPCARDEEGGGPGNVGALRWRATFMGGMVLDIDSGRSSTVRCVISRPRSTNNMGWDSPSRDFASHSSKAFSFKGVLRALLWVIAGRSVFSWHRLLIDKITSAHTKGIEKQVGSTRSACKTCDSMKLTGSKLSANVDTIGVSSASHATFHLVVIHLMRAYTYSPADCLRSMKLLLILLQKVMIPPCCGPQSTSS